MFTITEKLRGERAKSVLTAMDTIAVAMGNATGKKAVLEGSLPPLPSLINKIAMCFSNNPTLINLLHYQPTTWYILSFSIEFCLVLIF